MKESRVYIFLRVHALSLIPKGLFGVFCAGFYPGGEVSSWGLSFRCN